MKQSKLTLAFVELLFVDIIESELKALPKKAIHKVQMPK